MTSRFVGQKVAVLAGGLSSEREVSLITAKTCAEALQKKGYDTVLIDVGRDVATQLLQSRASVVFNGLHGVYGEDGRIQGLLDWMGIPYTGENLRSSLLAMDKGLAKAAFRAAGVPVANDVLISKNSILEGRTPQIPFDFPVVVKPLAEGSSVGVTIVQNPEDLASALKTAARSGDVLIEQFVKGVELSVVSQGQRSLGAVEIAPKRDFYDYTAKYDDAGTDYYVPPRISDEDLERVKQVGLAAHLALGCCGVTRTDVILTREGPIVLEVNTQPGMTSHSLVPKVAAAAGISFEDLVEWILDHAQCAEM